VKLEEFGSFFVGWNGIGGGIVNMRIVNLVRFLCPWEFHICSSHNVVLQQNLENILKRNYSIKKCTQTLRLGIEDLQAQFPDANKNQFFE